MLKPIMEDKQDIRISPKIIINYREKKRNVTVEKPGTHHLTLVIKVHIPRNETN
jgi:hypothetical protein